MLKYLVLRKTAYSGFPNSLGSRVEFRVVGEFSTYAAAQKEIEGYRRSADNLYIAQIIAKAEVKTEVTVEKL